MDTPKAATRSACDRCRAKRVRCRRGENNTTPCARCIHAGVRCVTGSPGYPGRPRKPRLVDGVTPGDPVMTPANVSPPGHGPTLRDSGHVQLHTPAAGELMLANMPTEWFDTGTASLNLLDDLGEVGLELSKSTTHPLKDPLLQGGSDSCTGPGGTSFFGFPLTEESRTSDSIPTLLEQLSNPSQHQELLNAADSVGMMYTAENSNDMLDVDSFIDSSECLSGPNPVQCLSAAGSLMRFQEKMEQRVSAMSTFFSDSRNVVEGCKEDDSMTMGSDNPVAVVLMCTKEFIDIIQSLTMATRTAASDSFTHNQLISPNNAPWIAQTESLSTESTLLVLSSYLTLMRLYDSLFHGVYHCLCQQPSENIKSIKVKAVFRIGGISSLQDMPVKAYAMGIIDVIQSQIQTLERCMGIPAAYCLAGEVSASQPTRGIFTNGDRARLFHTVMEQDDVKSQRGNKTYVESIRDNIKNSVAIFGD
ncbi:hypothetical protein F4803DRAFT_252475 [Xylaria telfairii]|nr:hypothetical protein F4803DRAFT_252475 [Xylaria telfairii]